MPTPSQSTFSGLNGEVGKKLNFEIRYRSRRKSQLNLLNHLHVPTDAFCKENLQSLGCIPRTPTPEPDLRQQNRTLRVSLLPRMW